MPKRCYKLCLDATLMIQNSAVHEIITGFVLEVSKGQGSDLKGIPQADDFMTRSRDNFNVPI